MKIAIGSDHRGHEAKQRIKALLLGLGVKLEDHGGQSGETCDYPDIALGVRARRRRRAGRPRHPAVWQRDRDVDHGQQGTRDPRRIMSRRSDSPDVAAAQRRQRAMPAR